MEDIELASLYLGKEAHYLNPGHVKGLRRVAYAVWQEQYTEMLKKNPTGNINWLENIYEED